MGCYDVYCLLCGNPCHSIIYNDDNYLNLSEKEFERAKIKIFDFYFAPTIQRKSKIFFELNSLKK